MDPTMEEKIKETVLDILKNSDMQEMTEFKVRKLASDQLGLDLSDSTHKKFVRQVVETFLLQQQQQNDSADAKAEQEQDQQEEEEDDDDDDESNKRRSDGKEYDDDGDLIVCHLSTKRRVTIQDFRGKTLVSIREYYDKGGKSLPTSKGISLTAEQWASLKKNVPAIEKAIQKIEGRLD